MQEKSKIHYTKFWKPDIKDDMLFFNGHFNTFAFDKHVHEEYTITLVHYGIMHAFLEGTTHHLGKSTILTINPDEIHACKSACPEGYNYTSLYFNPKVLENLSYDEFKSKDIYFDKTILQDEETYSKLANLVALNEKGDAGKLEFESGLVEAVSSIIQKNSKLSSQMKISKSDKLISRAKEFINDNFSIDISLDDISKELEISKYHFLRMFKEKTHISPHSYLMLKRVEKAKKALQKGTTLIDTAYSCGFNDQSHLNRRFKALTGLTPGNYQKFFK